MIHFLLFWGGVLALVIIVLFAALWMAGELLDASVPSFSRKGKRR